MSDKPQHTETVSVDKLIKEIEFEIVYMPVNPKEIFLTSKNINRLGLELIGSLKNFDKTRIVMIGKSENHFFKSFSEDEIKRSVDTILSLKPPLIISAYGELPISQIMKVAKKYKIPILVSKSEASELILELYSFLDLYLAQKIVRSAGLLNVHGEGILITGASGVGKSETSLELLKRGHRLISDDIIEIRKIGKNTLLGNAPKNVRHFMEIRGIGIINARRIFGVGSVKFNETIDLVINLEMWDSTKQYDRTGETTKFTEILGVKVPYVSIPVRPGRNLAVIIEAAAMNNRQRKMGFNAARELFISLDREYISAGTTTPERCLWDV